MSLLCAGWFLQREKIEPNPQEKRNGQTDIGYVGEGRTAAAHSRQGRDVSEW